MPNPFTRRPAPTEHDLFYATYVDAVPDGDVLATLEAQQGEAEALFGELGADRWDHRYAPDKWTIREVLGHVIDAERVFSLRALWFARGDAGPQPGMDQDEWMAGADFASRSPESLLSEYHHLRSANRALFASLGEALDRTGVASGCTFTVRALVWIVAGHERHHLEVLRARYL